MEDFILKIENNESVFIEKISENVLKVFVKEIDSKIFIDITTKIDVIADFYWLKNMISIVSKNKRLIFSLYDYPFETDSILGTKISCKLFSVKRPVVIKRTFDEISSIETRPNPNSGEIKFLSELNGESVIYKPVNVDKEKELFEFEMYLESNPNFF